MREVGPNSAAASLAAMARVLEDAAVSCVWTQWMLLGGTAAAQAPAHSVPPIDPEALLLASLGLLDAEPRLADVLHGWIRSNAATVSVQRLRNLIPHYAHLSAADGQQRLGWLAQIAYKDAKDARWRGLATAGTALPRVAGLEAPRTRMKSPPPPLRPTEPHHRMLRLRLGFGVGIKADVIAFLLGQEGAWHPIREIAGALTYTSAPVRRALEDLAIAAFIERQEGHPVRYGVMGSRWHALLGASSFAPGWGRWDERFRFVADWLTWARAPRPVEITAYILSVQARDTFARHRAAFGAREALAHLAGAETSAVIEATAREIDSFSEALRALQVGMSNSRMA